MKSINNNKNQIAKKTLFFRELNSKDNQTPYYINFKKALRILKIILYCFSTFMIFFSFIQTIAKPYTNYSSQPGSGLEFGFLPGINGTKDIRYDLFSIEINPYKFHAFYMPTFKYGPFLSWFVFPFAYLFNVLMWKFSLVSSFLNDTGLNVILSMLIIMFFMRFITFLTTLRAAYYTDKQQQHKTNLNNINAKYERYNLSDPKIKQSKHKEISDYNKKYNLKPFAPFENFFINTPIFLIVFKIITISRPIKFTTLFSIWELSKTPFTMIFYHLFDTGWAYLLLCCVIIPVNFLSQRAPSYFSKKRHKTPLEIVSKDSPFNNTAKIQNIMTVVFLLFTFFWTTGLAIYYFLNSLFTILQSVLIHLILKGIKIKKNTFDDKLKKFGIN